MEGRFSDDHECPPGWKHPEIKKKPETKEEWVGDLSV